MVYNSYRPLRRPGAADRPASGTPAGPVPGPQPDPVPARRRARPTRTVVAVGGVAVFVALCVAAATDIAFRHIGSPGGPAATAAPAIQHAAPAAPATPTASPAVILPERPRTLLSIDGQDNGTTKTFTTGAAWYLRFSYDCPASAPGAGRLQIYEYSADHAGAELVNESDEDGTDTLPQQGRAGRRYLRITSTCSWTVTVIG